jgi:hypothetical protein
MVFGVLLLGLLRISQAQSFAVQEKDGARPTECRKVEPGNFSLVVGIELPEGYAISDDAPSSLKVTSSNPKAVAFGGKADASAVDPVFPLKLKARAGAGTADLRFDFNVYYCGHKDSSVCKVYRKSVTIPLTVAKGSGVKSIKITHKIVAP